MATELTDQNEQEKLVDATTENTSTENEPENKNLSISEISQKAFDKVDDKNIPDPPSSGGRASVPGEEE